MEPNTRSVESSLLPIRRVLIVLAYLLAVGTVLAAYVQGVGRANALAAVEPGTFPCNGMLQFGNTPANPGIKLQGASTKVVSVPDQKHAGESVDQVQITWSGGLAEKGVQCIWIAAKGVGETEFSGEAVAILPADATSYSVNPTGIPGQYCYRIIPVSQTAPAPPTDLCVDVQHPTAISSEQGQPGQATVTTSPTSGAAQQTTSPRAPATGSGVAQGDGGVAVLSILGAGTLVFASITIALATAWKRQRGQ